MVEKSHFKDWEKDFIYLAYPTFTNFEVAEYLNRSIRSITMFVSQYFPQISKEKVEFNINKKYGLLTPITIANNIVECHCDCGKIIFIHKKFIIGKRGSRSCGCLRLHSITTKYRNITGTWYGNLQRGANKRGIEFNLSQEFLQKLLEKQQFKCALSNMTLNISTKRSSKEFYLETTASLDRIDNTKGYIEDNVQFLHKHINYMKWEHEQSYFIELCKMIVENQK